MLGGAGSGKLEDFLNAGILPIAEQEPLSELQRWAELFEFAAILEKVYFICFQALFFRDISD